MALIDVDTQFCRRGVSRSVVYVCGMAAVKELFTFCACVRVCVCVCVCVPACRGQLL